jgi:hypothetical protein
MQSANLACRSSRCVRFEVGKALHLEDLVRWMDVVVVLQVNMVMPKFREISREKSKMSAAAVGL